MRTKNVFYNLIKNEDTFTEAFVNMLINEDVKNKFEEYFRKIFQNKNIKFDFEDIQTQFIGFDSERPDILIKNENIYLVIENKINVNTDTTHNQKNGYKTIFNQSIKDKQKILLFIIPKMYKKKNEIDSILSELNDDDIFSIKAYWENIIDYIKDSSNDICFQNFIETANEYLNYQIVQMGENDMKNLKEANASESFKKIIGIIENLKKSFKSEGYKIEIDIDEYNYGFYLIDENSNYIIYTGIVYDNWIETKEPLYLGFSEDFNKNIIRKVNSNYKTQTFGDDEFRYVPIYLEELIENNDSTEYIKNKIDKIIN